jgi:hypothetical protein
MTKIRNKTIIKQVLARDLGLCRCCGYKASEVHHVIPLCFGGEDKVNNMISLCYTCHLHAPNTKESFYRYMKEGGARTQIISGKLLNICEEGEIKSKGTIKFQELLNFGRMVLIELKKVDLSNALERYSLLDSNLIEDVDFELIKEIEECVNEVKEQ